MDEEEEESLQLQGAELPLQGRYYRATDTTGLLPTDFRERSLLDVRNYRVGTGTTGRPVLPPHGRYYRCTRACVPIQGIFPCILSTHLPLRG